ncbi:MAG: hypothetical protein QXF28_07445 [Nitrososphaerota archaeon]
MAQLIDPETAFWITIDIIIASLAAYALFKYIKLKRRITKPDNSIEVDQHILTNRFREYLSRKGGRQAVITIFNEVVDGLAEARQLNARKNLTTREILTILNGKLAAEIQNLLHEMYSLYEAARFGGYEPSEVEIDQFSKQLERLDNLSIREYPSRWLNES